MLIYYCPVKLRMSNDIFIGQPMWHKKVLLQPGRVDDGDARKESHIRKK